MTNTSDTTDLKCAIIISLSIAALYLCYDVWIVAFGTVNVNEHIPFFMPIVFTIFALIARKIKKHVEAMTPEQQERLRASTRRDSCLSHPRNTDYW